MRLVEFNEESELRRYADIINHECRPFLDEAKGYRFSVWRGARELNIKLVKLLPAHLEDRRPLSTNRDIHDGLNKAFVKKFGKPYRNGVHASGNEYEVAAYGTPYVFMPVGKYSYCWSPIVEDIYNDIRPIHWLKAKGGFDGDRYIERRGYQEVNLKKAIKSDKEIMFWCNDYYLINENITDELGKLLTK